MNIIDIIYQETNEHIRLVNTFMKLLKYEKTINEKKI